MPSRRSLDRALIERHLREADRHVVAGRGIIAQQQRIIAELEVDGHDTGPGRALLKTYRDIQEILEAHRSRLSEELTLRLAKRSLLH